MDISGLKTRFGFLQSGTCPQCGAPLYHPKTCPHVHGCFECGYTSIATKSQEERLREIQLQNRKDEALNYLRNTSCFGSPKVFNYNFGNYSPIDEKEAQVRNKALNMADKLAKGIKNDPMHIFLQGGTGRGKTHIAMAMMYEVLHESDYSKAVKKRVGDKYEYKQTPLAVTFVNWSRFMTLKQESIRDDDKASQFTLINTSLQTADIAIIDDLGKESNNDWYFQTFDELMEIREDQHIIITTNLEGEDLIKRYGDRSMSRLRKHARGNFISFAGIQDHRMLKEGK
ncbi:hypothetical protein E5340_05530 [Ligilactobacillus murinus]|uniref:ATP-binding protein n=1 Tax=Ligilactobacillus murinus TaxID=1622 RepID=A0A4S2EHN5_9LACO|nr:DnaA/Hda family protein [Ligilactobacillus murinus]TGY55469.1 hypothetical protein E5340_05530 [Ligilactobacillus murinus]